jgi:hypothetical protein
MVMQQEDADEYSSDARSESSDLSVIDMCPLESQCNPSLDGVFDKSAVLERVMHLSASELAALS